MRNNKSIELKILVTGTGRCGTVFMARLLTSLGIPCGHESIFNWDGIDGAVGRLVGSWPITQSVISQENSEKADWLDLNDIQAESSYMSAPFLSHVILKTTQLVHIVRHPVQVIDSFINSLGYFSQPEPQDRWESFIFMHLPELKSSSLTNIDRGALYYLSWNYLIESQLLDRGFYFHRVEDDPPELLNFLGLKSTTSMFDNKSANTLKEKKKNPEGKFTIDMITSEIIKRELINIGEKYGYSMD